MEEGLLKKHSYSSIDVFCNCPRRYDLTYNKDFRSKVTTLALGMVSIAHKCLELLILTQMGKLSYTLDEIINILYEGWIEPEPNNEEQKTKDGNLLGVNALKEQFFEDFLEGGYSTKLITFKNLLAREFIMGDWKPIAVEQEFTYNFKDICLFHGFIDRVDMNSKGELRVVDYKSSKKIYENKKLNHSMQMGVYKNACLDLFGKIPVEYVYHFVFLDEQQNALQGKFLNKIDEEIIDTLTNLYNCSRSDSWAPQPSPLCYWCPFHGTSPNADPEFIGRCQYFSLWTPNNKTFKVHKPYFADINEAARVDW